MNPRVFVLTMVTFAFGSAAFIFAGLLETLAHDLGVGEELVVPTAMAQLFEALVQLHSAGIVHRDVKVWGGAAAAPPLPPLARPPARTPPPFHTTRSPTM